jgi:PadR family transcriptional regulator PadR
MNREPPPLGEFEQLILLAVLQASRTDDGAYGISVFDELTRRTRRRIARAAVYMTLDRLEKKGLLSSWTTRPIAERGGRARRCYQVTRPALSALRESQATLQGLWSGVDLMNPKRTS